MIPRKFATQQGFSLMELIITLAVMSIVALAAYSLNDSMQKTAYREAEVTDTQTHLRVALDLMVADIRLAGFMVAGDPIINNTANELTIRTAAVTNVFARVTNNLTATGTDTFQVAMDTMSERFHTGAPVRIIRPPMLIEPDPRVFTVSTVGSSQLTLSGLTGGVAFQAGDVIVETRAGAPTDSQIRYFIDADNNLVRQVNGTGQQLVPHVTQLLFQYQPNDDGLVKRVDITLTATSNPNKAAMIGTKTKSLQTTVTLRNV